MILKASQCRRYGARHMCFSTDCLTVIYLQCDCLVNQNVTYPPYYCTISTFAV